MIAGFHDKKYYIPVLFFWVSVLNLPRLSFIMSSQGTASKLRFDDFFAPFALIYIFMRGKELIILLGKRLSVIMSCWIVFILFLTPINAVAGNYPMWICTIFALKEVQYIVYLCFFIVFAARNPRYAAFSFLIASVPLYAYALFQFLQGRFMGYYGIKFIFEEGKPAPSEIGAIAAFLFICALSVLLNKKKLLKGKKILLNISVYLATITAFLIVVSTLSRSSIIGALGAALFLILVKLVQGLRNPLIMIRAAIIIILIFISILIFQQTSLFEQFCGRFSQLTYKALPGRMYWWQFLINYQFSNPGYNLPSIFFGLGLGSPNVFMGEPDTLTLGVDNQYVRRLFEVGIIGSLLWFIFLGAIGMKILRNAKNTEYKMFFKDLTFGLLIVTAIASVGLEILQVIRIATNFYALIGSILGLSYAVSMNVEAKKRWV